MRVFNRPGSIACALFAISMTLWMDEASAEEAISHRIYLGVRSGPATIDSSTPVSNLGKIYSLQVARTWTDHSTTAWSANVGFQVSRFLALEASYWDFGKGVFNESRRYYGPTVDERDEYIGAIAEAKGVAVGLALSYPWKNVRASAKFDALKSNVSLSGSGTRSARDTVRPTLPAVVSSVTKDQGSDSTNLMYGAALSYTWAGHFRALLEWRKAGHLGDQQQNGGLDVEVKALGFEYQF